MWAAVAIERRLKHADGKIVRHHPEPGENGKIVGGVLFPSQDGQVHFGNGGVAHLVGGHEEHIADDEFDQGLQLLRREALGARLLGQRARGFVEPRLKFCETGLNLRRGGRSLLR